MMKTKGYSKGGKMKTKGYAKGGALKMVEKDGKKVPFYAADGKGKMAKGGEVPEAEPTKAGKGKINPKRKKFLEEMEAGNKKVGADIKARDKKAKAAMNNTSDPKPKTPAQAAMGAAPAGGMGMPPKKPMGMKKGGKVKTKGYAKGGKVRGAGIAKKGVRPCKMR